MSVTKSTSPSLLSMPKRSLLSVACCLALSAGYANAATIDLGNDASFSIGGGLRVDFSSVDHGATNGTDSSSDFSVSNTRLYLSGRVNKFIGATFNTERTGADGLRVMDAYAQFEFTPEFNIWAGRLLPASDRANLDGPFYLNVWEYPFVSGYPNLAVGRDNGVQAWGKLLDSKLTYVAGVFKGHNRVVGGSNTADNPLYTGRLAYALWDPEPAPAYYTGSTYYGSKDILTVGIAGMYQKDGVGVAASKGDYKGLSIDVLFEKKLGADAVTVEGAYYRTSLGALDCGSGEPGAPACPAAGPNDNVGGLISSKAYLLTGAYLIGEQVGWGQFQPFARYQKLERNASATSKSQFDLGVNYVIKGHNARLSAVYSKVKDDALPSPKDDIGKFVVGAQLQF